MLKRLTIIIPAALAVAALAPAAASASGVGGVQAFSSQSRAGLPSSADAAYRVPAGKVEHRVWTVTVSGSKAVPKKERQELWLTATRARLVATTIATGKVRTEVVDRPGESRIFDARTNRLTILRHKTTDPPPYASSAFEAALHRAYVQEGIMRVTGEQVVAGRRALMLESVPGKWISSDPGSRGTALVDAETYRVLQTRATLGEGLFNQTVDTTVDELVSAQATVTAKLAARRHTGAKVSRIGR
jgi:hypothetical protein